MLNNKVYDVLKWITLVLLPALTTLVGVILNCFNVGCTDYRKYINWYFN